MGTQRCRSCGKETYDGGVHHCPGLQFITEPGFLQGIMPDKKIKVSIPVSTLTRIYAALSLLDPSIVVGHQELMKTILDILDGN